MNQLDDFEKQLRDQLKGHVAPEPLMWSRLSDALGRVKPWYAKNIFKYGLTAFTSLIVGSYGTFYYLEQQHLKPNTKAAIQQNATKPSNNQVLAKASINNNAYSPLTSANIYLPSSTTTVLTESPINTDSTSQTASQNTNLNKTRPDEAIHQALALTTAPIDLSAMPPRAPQLIGQAKSQLQLNKTAPYHSSALTISLSSGKMATNLPSFTYQIGPIAQHQTELTNKISPLLQLQFPIFRNWHLNAGVQQLSSSTTEHFLNTEVFSYDDKEHFLFPYLFGYRKISDEELHGGQWPFGPNPPVGPETSMVLADYSSMVQTNSIYVPVSVSYHKQIGLFEAQLHAGLGMHFGYRNTQTLNLPGYLPSTILLNNDFLNFHTAFQTQVRLNYIANPHLAIFIEPQMRLALRQQKFLTTQAYRPLSSGLYAGISWKF